MMVRVQLIDRQHPDSTEQGTPAKSFSVYSYTHINSIQSLDATHLDKQSHRCEEEVKDMLEITSETTMYLASQLEVCCEGKLDNASPHSVKLYRFSCRASLYCISYY